MKKDTEWLKKEFDEVVEFRKQSNPSSSWGMGSNAVLKYIKEDFKNLINQLDEPEVLSQEWIDNNSINASHDGVTDEYVHVDDLENLLVPKQEEVKRVQIPEWIIEWYQGANNKYSTLEDVFSNLSHDTGYNIMDSEKFRSRIMEYGGFSKMYEALSRIYFGVYEIEEEQKYYVLNEENELILGWSQSAYMTPCIEGYEYMKHNGRENLFQLTEQEIKDYDERYLAFKVPVEEVTE